jgi:hypothetical protein
VSRFSNTFGRKYVFNSYIFIAGFALLGKAILHLTSCISTSYYVTTLIDNSMVNYSSGNIGRSTLHNPKNCQQRTVTDRDNNLHLEIFFNGSWRHDSSCKEFTNKECRK